MVRPPPGKHGEVKEEGKEEAGLGGKERRKEGTKER